MNKDYLIKAMDSERQLRVFLAHTTSLVEEAHRRHNTSATASAALGRVLTAALMMGSDLKGSNDALTLRVDGNGMAGPIVAAVNSGGQGRAFISNPQSDLPSRYPGKLAVGELVGKDGFLEVIKDMGLKQPFIGRVPLVSGEIAEDLARYYLDSEQIPSLVSLGVLVDTDLSIKAAGGLFIQAMPGADQGILEVVEKNVIKMGTISEVMNNSNSLEDILAQVLQGMEYIIVGGQPLAFKCTCSHNRLAMILASFSSEEINETYQNEGKLEVTCNFCNQIYYYVPEEIEAMKSKKP
ncbi:MAG: Hsp33 family molecular chaperone HslO [Syntrophomonas sp.]